MHEQSLKYQQHYAKWSEMLDERSLDFLDDFVALYNKNFSNNKLEADLDEYEFTNEQNEIYEFYKCWLYFTTAKNDVVFYAAHQEASKIKIAKDDLASIMTQLDVLIRKNLAELQSRGMRNIEFIQTNFDFEKFVYMSA